MWTLAEGTADLERKSVLKELERNRETHRVRKLMRHCEGNWGYQNKLLHPKYSSRNALDIIDDYVPDEFPLGRMSGLHWRFLILDLRMHSCVAFHSA